MQVTVGAGLGGSSAAARVLREVVDYMVFISNYLYYYYYYYNYYYYYYYYYYDHGSH